MIVLSAITDRDMIRNLDMTALRAFVTVAEMGGVTKAAGRLHLTQSAVSMQLKRLEEALGQALLDRSARSISLTPHGEQLLSYGRRMLRLNDEVWGRMTDQAFEGEIGFGVPADIVYPHIPGVLQRFARAYPRVKVQLISSFTSILKEQLANGELDMILTTELGLDKGGETLQSSPLVWVGAKDGVAFRQRPLRLAFERDCLFKPPAVAALDGDAIDWEMAVDTDSYRTVEASVSADLAVHAGLLGATPPHSEVLPDEYDLPRLPAFLINQYVGTAADMQLCNALAAEVRAAYQSS